MLKTFALIFLLCAAVCAQVSVALSPPPRHQFFDANGQPLAHGQLFTYDGGTTSPSNTYIDSGGSVQNTNPIILDAGGYADIWLANQSYKFCLFDQNGVPQWGGCVDNITGYLGLLNLANTWTFPQIFTQPVSITPSDNQLIFGQLGSQTIIDAPPAAGGGVTLHNQTGQSDTYIYRNSTDILNNKTLINPVLTSPFITTPNIFGCQLFTYPGTCLLIDNEGSTGTVGGKLAKLTGAPSKAIITSITDTGGVIGVVTSGGGIGGTATIAESGNSTCIFDGATAAGDYVQISQTVAGDCHDVGSSYPTSGGQVVGRVLSTNASGGVYNLNLFGAEVRAGAVYPQVIYSTSFLSNPFSPSLGGAILAAPLVDTTYRFSMYVHQAAAGTTCTGTSSIALTLQIQDSYAAGTINPVLASVNVSGTVASWATVNVAVTGNGAAGNYLATVLPHTFRVKAGSNVILTSVFTAGAACTIAPTYELNPIVEQMAAN